MGKCVSETLNSQCPPWGFPTNFSICIAKELCKKTRKIVSESGFPGSRPTKRFRFQVVIGEVMPGSTVGG